MQHVDIILSTDGAACTVPGYVIDKPCSIFLGEINDVA